MCIFFDRTWILVGNILNVTYTKIVSKIAFLKISSRQMWYVSSFIQVGRAVFWREKGDDRKPANRSFSSRDTYIHLSTIISSKLMAAGPES